MHELIETFLKDVLRYQGKNSNAVREDVQHLLTACENQIRDAENDHGERFRPPNGSAKRCGIG